MAYTGYPGQGFSIPPPPPPVNVAPNMADFVYEIAVPPSPNESPNRGGAGGAKSPYIVYGGDDRGKDYHDDRDRSRLAVGRSSSTKEHRRAASVQVGDSRDRRDRSRPRSTYYHGGGRYDDDYRHPRGRADKVYYGHDNYYAESTYSGSSQGSRENSRERYSRHHRTPSAHSEMGDRYYDAQYPLGPPGVAAWGPPVPPPPPMPGQPGMSMALAPLHPPQHHPGQPLMAPGSMVPWQPPVVISPEQEELNKKIAELQLELKKSKEESEKIEKTKAEVEAQRKKEAELKEAVKKEIDARAAAEKKAAEAAAAEQARIQEQARKLLEAQEAAKKAAAEKEKEEKAKLEKLVEERLAAENQKNQAVMLDLRKPTHTKFSKTHLCKEALDERKISYTEHEDSFLVHRWVDRDEQNQLWARTKQIRGAYPVLQNPIPVPTFHYTYAQTYLQPTNLNTKSDSRKKQTRRL
ncbi:hypothetical protein EV426DRAFT_362416 [Tirmania nivea]|nr:hypothetical protein EV426DRAFT_362416 [Tirmania nivea]